MDNREQFIDKLRSTKREGIENVIAGLQELGFFTAPASSRFHMSHEGGLALFALCKIYTYLKLKNDARHKRKRYYKVGDGCSGLDFGMLPSFCF